MIMGMAQWLVLRARIRRAGWWIIASAVGWVVGLAVITVASPSAAGAVFGAVLGATTGTAQWLVLRLSVYQAGWWIVISILGWALGPIFGATLVGGIVGAVTGVSLELLVRHPLPKT